MVKDMRKVLVTGGSRGIGRAIVQKYENNGYEVVAPSRKELDLSYPESVEEYVERHKNESFHVLVNNAGCNLINDFVNVNDEEMNQMLQVNLVSPIRLIRGFLPAMKKLEYGRIVNIGSIWGIISKPGRGIYSTTKHGVHGVTNTLALEVGQYNILVNTVCPGQTITELTYKNNSLEEIRQMERDIPLGRLAQPEEIANVVYFLGSEDNTYITGQQIIVDGGISVQ